MSPRLGWLLILALLGAACTEPVSAARYSLSKPVAFALVCQKPDGASWKAVALAECGSDVADSRLLAFVAGGPTGDVGILDLTSGEAIDTDPVIPGATRLFVGTYVSDIAASPDSKHVYAVDLVEQAVVVIDPVKLTFETVGLPHAAQRVLYDSARLALLMTVPAEGLLLRVPLDKNGKPGVADELAVGGAPSSLALAQSGLLLVGDQAAQSIGEVDAAEWKLLDVRVGLVEPCRDGLDNDKDGLVDAADPGCDTPVDWDETDVELCGDTVDNDLDGETDEDGCTEAAALPACANGIDDDGDRDEGSEDPASGIDLLDPGCRDRTDGAEETDAPACGECVQKDKQVQGDYPCADGEDNDGDGKTDLDDDGCFAAGWGTEEAVPPPLAEVAISPDGRWAYVLHRGLNQVSVLDVEAGLLVDVNAVDDATERLIRRLRGVYAIEFTNRLGAVLFEPDEKALFACVADMGGMVTRLTVEQDGKGLHQVAQSDEEDQISAATKPRLFVDGSEVELGFTQALGHPNLGPLSIETIDAEKELKSYYGITFTESLRAQRNETWTVAYEGALPGTSKLEARVVSPTLVVVDHADLCRLGALAGDWFVLVQDGPSECDAYEDGESYDFLTVEVGPDYLELEGPGRHVDDAGEETKIDKLDPNCFTQAVSFQVRPKARFTVVGGRTGYLHTVETATLAGEGVAGRQVCRESANGPAKFTARADAAEVALDKDGQPKELPACPVTGQVKDPKSGEELLKLHPFENPLLSFNIFPPCTVTPEGKVQLASIERGTVWTFDVVSGFVSQVVLAGQMLVDGLLLEARDLLFALDLSGRSVKQIDLESFELEAGIY